MKAGKTMRKAEKSFYRQFLRIHLFLILSLILGSELAFAEQEFIVHTNMMFRTKQNEECSIVKVHNLFSTEDGKVFHQEGMGWVVHIKNSLAVLTPAHVIANYQLLRSEEHTSELQSH